MAPNLAAAIMLAALPSVAPSTPAIIPATNFEQPAKSSPTDTAGLIATGQWGMFGPIGRSTPQDPAAITLSSDDAEPDQPEAGAFLTDPGPIVGPRTFADPPGVSDPGAPGTAKIPESLPEPSSGMMLSVGLSGIAMLSRWRRLLPQRFSPTRSVPVSSLTNLQRTAGSGVGLQPEGGSRRAPVMPLSAASIEDRLKKSADALRQLRQPISA